MHENKKGGGLALLIKMGKKKEDASNDKPMADNTDVGSPPDSSPDLNAGESTDKSDMAADDLFDAMQTGDKDSFRAAFKNALKACMDSY
jgi:hypothetical protein